MKNIKISDSLRATLKDCASTCRPAYILIRTGSPIYMGRRDPLSSKRGERIIAGKLIGDFFSMRESAGMISYMPAGRTQEFTADGRWTRKGRQTISPVKWLRSMFSERVIEKLRLTEKDFAAFSPAFKASENKNALHFVFVSFEAAYDQARYVEGEIGSCMWNKPVGAFYEDVGAKVVVAVNSENKFVARAIVWDNAKTFSGESIPMIDRIYAREPWHVEAMKEWALSSGRAHLVKQSNSNEGYLILPDGSTSSKGLKIPAPDDDHDFYPYLDTFRWQVGGRILSECSSNACYTYDLTNGSRSPEEDDEPYAHDVDGNPIETESEADDDYHYVDGDYYPCDDSRICWVGSCNEYMLRRHCVRLRTGDYLPKDDAVEVNGCWYAEDDDDVVRTIGGDWALQEDCVYISYAYYMTGDERVVTTVDADYALKADCVEIDGDYYPLTHIDICQTHDGGYALKDNCRRSPDTGAWIPLEEEECMEEIELAEKAAGGRV